MAFYRDPTEIFREFFGGLDPFEELAMEIMGGRQHMCANRVHRNRHRHSHDHDSQARNSVHSHNETANAAGNVGSPHRAGRSHRCRRTRELQPRVPPSALHPINNIHGKFNPRRILGSPVDIIRIIHRRRIIYIMN